MGKVLAGMTMSLDGFVSDRKGSVDLLYPDLEALRRTDMLQELIRATGAVVMGRHAYDMADGDLTGYEFQVPIFVLTHHIPEQPPRGQNDRLSVTFVTDGIDSAVERAKEAAGNLDVTMIGGANTIAQAVQAGLVDELQIGIRPVLIGSGLPLFEHLVAEPLELELTHLYELPDAVYVRFRVTK